MHDLAIYEVWFLVDLTNTFLKCCAGWLQLLNKQFCLQTINEKSLIIQRKVHMNMFKHTEVTTTQHYTYTGVSEGVVATVVF